MKKTRSLRSRQVLTGNLFCVPLYLGAILFFITPIIQSIVYIFSEVQPELGSIAVKNIGFENIRYIFREDQDFVTNLISSSYSQSLAFVSS